MSELRKIMAEWSDNCQGPLLKSLIQLNQCKTIVEIGVSCGTSTRWMCEGAKLSGGHVYGFDCWERHGSLMQFEATSTKEDVENYLIENGHEEVFTLNKIDSKSTEFIGMLKQMCPKIDLAFIDGDHSYGGIFNDFSYVYPLLNPEGGIIMFHDTLMIDGCREFIIDLRTIFNDGTFDIVDFPWGNNNRVGISLLVKRSYPLINLPIFEKSGSPSSHEEIFAKEKSWLKEEIKRYE